eukprot:531325_1
MSNKYVIIEHKYENDVENIEEELKQSHIHSQETDAQLQQLSSVKIDTIITPVFKSPRHSDFIDCKIDDHYEGDCNIMKRLVHLLKFYEQYQTNTIRSPPVIYEYIATQQDYDVPTFMEDWHYAKNNHLRKKQCLNWIKNTGLQCNNIKQCVYIRRYRRDSEIKELSSNTEHDYKNIILMEKFASIHTFIFHSVTNTRISQFKSIES